MTKFVNHGFPHDEEIGVMEQNATFIQHSDTNDEERYQYFRVETSGVDFDPKDNTDSFFRVSTGDPFAYNPDKTDVAPFWSCMGPEDIVAMFNEAARRMGMQCRWKCEKFYVRSISDLAKEEIIPDNELEQIVADHKKAEQKRTNELRKKMGLENV